MKLADVKSNYDYARLYQLILTRVTMRFPIRLAQLGLALQTHNYNSLPTSKA